MAKPRSALGGLPRAVKRKFNRHIHTVAPLIVAAVFLTVVFLGDSDRDSVRANQAALGGLGGGAVAALDEVSAAKIAADIAEGADLIVAENVKNLVDSQLAQVEFVTNEGAYLTKPQLVTTDAKTSSDIVEYVVQRGDTIPKIARRFNITSDTIRWENNISGDSVAAGRTLRILPVSGIRYTVQEGDSADGIARRFGLGSANFLVAFNDAEIDGFKAGDKIIIPDGRRQPTSSNSNFFSSGFAFGSAPLYGGNGYSYGYCTYYVATRVNVPRNWGNANTWDIGAALSGWTVSSKPRVGAIAQTRTMHYLGHVAYVEEVSSDGKKIKISDMNGVAGWNIVGYSDWMPTSTYEHYIYR